jgi:hypothetical protein
MAFGQGSSRWPDWLKMKNPEAPAVKREAEEGAMTDERDEAGDEKERRHAALG